MYCNYYQKKTEIILEGKATCPLHKQSPKKDLKSRIRRRGHRLVSGQILPRNGFQGVSPCQRSDSFPYKNVFEFLAVIAIFLFQSIQRPDKDPLPTHILNASTMHTGTLENHCSGKPVPTPVAQRARTGPQAARPEAAWSGRGAGVGAAQVSSPWFKYI